MIRALRQRAIRFSCWLTTRHQYIELARRVHSRKVIVTGGLGRSRIVRQQRIEITELCVCCMHERVREKGSPS